MQRGVHSRGRLKSNIGRVCPGHLTSRPLTTSGRRKRIFAAVMRVWQAIGAGEVFEVGGRSGLSAEGLAGDHGGRWLGIGYVGCSCSGDCAFGILFLMLNLRMKPRNFVPTYRSRSQVDHSNIRQRPRRFCGPLSTVGAIRRARKLSGDQLTSGAIT
jgi:hypothetical protein